MTTSEQLNNMAAIIQAQEEIARYNDDLDKYVTGDLLNEFSAAGISVIDGRISGGNIMRAASIYYHKIREVFGERAFDLLEEMHARGYDVRLDMQSYRLVWKGVYKNA